MSFGPKRGHVMFIFERFFRDFGLMMLYILAYLLIGDKQILLDNMTLAFIAFFLPVKRLFEYLTTFYTINNEALLIKSGLLKKTVQEIPLANITAVDFTQPVIFQLAKVYCIHVENAGGIADAGKGATKIVLKDKDAEIVKGLLLAQTTSNDELQAEQADAASYRASAGSILIMGFMQGRAIVIILELMGLIGIVAGVASSFLERTGDIWAEAIVEYIVLYGITLLIAGVVGLYIFSKCGSAVMDLIKYYGFKVTDRGNSLFVEYGFFTKKTHTIMKDKISGINYRQSIFMRLLKSGTLEVFVAGYGGMDEDNREETVMLYPVISEEELYPYLDMILPGAAEAPDYEYAPKKSLPYFFVCVRMIVTIVLFAAVWMIPADLPKIKTIAVVVAALLIVEAIISVIMEYMNSAVSAETKMVVLRTGGFRRETTLIVREKIESAEDSAGNRKRNKIGVSTIILGVLAPTAYSTHKVRNMELHVFDKLKDGLLY